MVLTCRMWRSHGCFLGSGEGSTGRIVLMDASSSSESFHTTSLLSLPCLGIVSENGLVRLKRE